MPLNKFDLSKDQPKELPNNIEAEQSVIGSILVSNDIFDDVSPIINTQNFTILFTKKFFWLLKI